MKQDTDVRKQYEDFGNAIQSLGENVQQLGKVIENFTSQIPQPLPPDGQWDLKSFVKICGDFGRTIQECRQLLHDRRKFADVHEGPAGSQVLRNIQWNLAIEPEVRRLYERVKFHNIKIITMLKPFEMTLMLDLNDNVRKMQKMQSKLAGRMEEGFLDILLAIQGIWTPNTQEAIAQAMKPPPDLPAMPDYMDSRFDVATNASRKAGNQELLEGQNFPFYLGITAFHRHFDESTIVVKPAESVTAALETQTGNMPTISQYLNLMKSIWILKRIKEGDESFRVWLDDDEDDDIFESTDDYLDEILRVSLKSTARGRKQELVIIRKDHGELQLQNVTSKVTGVRKSDTLRDPVVLDRACLIPWYANPHSSPKTYNVAFRGDERAQAEKGFIFEGLQDLLDFQQAITANKVVFDKSTVRTRLFQPTSCFSSNHIKGAGRIQIWFPKRLEPRFSRPQLFNREMSQRSITTRSSNALSVPKTFMTACTSPVEMDDMIG
ncbi:uncharacterized protein KY384_007446 [Bacidia gigantensis]|uniref:uncharacterized protein n=1 Tax=Bacidia gigantensis TaxID=2732470 RepID=UPI001D05300E|nr:uncharacterized protein KY384_007446 [Bacidia gigantensis]KAG8528528.1 hypothetical protein KY384_007446 [Bacidia gigantensis]